MTTLKQIMEAVEANKTAQSEKMDEVLATVNETKSELETAIGRIDEIEKSTSIAEKGTISVPGCVDTLKNRPFNLAAVYRGLHLTKQIGEEAAWKGFEAEKEIVVAATEKALNVGADISGGYVVPAEIMSEMFIPLLRDRLVLEDLGANIITGVTGEPIEIPEQTGSATGYWVGEQEAPTESQQTLGMRELRPKRCGAFLKVGNRLLKNAQVSGGLNDMIVKDIMAVLTRTAQQGILFGTGAKQPTGLINTSGINTYAIGTNGGVLDFDDIDEMVGLIEDANADTVGDIKFLMHNQVKRRLKRLKVANYSGQTSEQPYLLGRPPMKDSELSDFMGYDFKTTNQVPTNLTKGSGTSLSYVIAAVWSELIVMFWESMIVKMSDTAGDNTGSALRQNQTWMVAQFELDSTFRHRGALTLCSDAQAG